MGNYKSLRGFATRQGHHDKASPHIFLMSRQKLVELGLASFDIYVYIVKHGPCTI